MKAIREVNGGIKGKAYHDMFVELSVRCARPCATVYHHTLTLLRQVFARCGICTIEVSGPALRCMLMGLGVLDDMKYKRHLVR